MTVTINRKEIIMSHVTDSIEAMLFDEVTFKPTAEILHNKKEVITDWPIFEIKGSAGQTFDVCTTLESARTIVAGCRLKRYEIWQIDKTGMKKQIMRSHNEAGFAVLNTTLRDKLRSFNGRG